MIHHLGMFISVEELLRLLLHEKRRDGPIDWVDVKAMGEEDGDLLIWVSASGRQGQRQIEDKENYIKI